MTARGYLRGHEIYCVNDEWFYSDNNEPTAYRPPAYIPRSCGHCNLPNREDGHDACLGILPGVSNACCGHGKNDESYVQFKNGLTVRGFKIDKQ